MSERSMHTQQVRQGRNGSYVVKRSHGRQVRPLRRGVFILILFGMIVWCATGQPTSFADGVSLFLQRGMTAPNGSQEAETVDKMGETADNQSDSSAESMANRQSDPWNLILVNKWNPIPAKYEVQLTALSNGESVDARIYPDLQRMFDDARAEGIQPIVAAGYRTQAKQESLMDEKIAALKAEGLSQSDATREAETWVAPPGTSEHQLGIAVDINADANQSSGNDVYVWLSQNAWKYGFILRYPAGKLEVTGCNHEPWHYRYIGGEAAEKMYREGICLEEYLNGMK